MDDVVFSEQMSDILRATLQELRYKIKRVLRYENNVPKSPLFHQPIVPHTSSYADFDHVSTASRKAAISPRLWRGYG